MTVGTYQSKVLPFVVVRIAINVIDSDRNWLTQPCRVFTDATLSTFFTKQSALLCTGAFEFIERLIVNSHVSSQTKSVGKVLVANFAPMFGRNCALFYLSSSCMS